ncbi:tryptophan 2,3-dioxygenase family protein [Bdellovibrio bacteriovorus]|uniref:Tryptophan 2,3-dioxygenase n=1 Tax=Bdellovibrio bacteriovorus TaxID=959 RepID=A0A150WTK3_BDEBC|nr:tryptophan 2,3-dioxygenase family protein [Bdellovibrio bacteriovorus]KYG69827.1 tryptophan 2,3-dioxygenase [Bdellovibrio bacteriovorus]
MKYPPVHYHSYLGLDPLLNSQHRKSEEYGKPAHDEMLFIITHQAYELWFKQVLFELDSVLEIFKKSKVAETDMGLMSARLERSVAILKMIIGHVDILETMTPLDFLDFRDMLYPASGFQSFQWRLLETKLGLRMDDRLSYNQAPFYKSLSESQQGEMQKVISQPSLYDSVEKWLERTPFLQGEDFNFWDSYKKAVATMFQEDMDIVKNNPRLSDEDKKKNIEGLQATLKSFDALFDEQAFEQLRKEGQFRLSYKGMHAALLIQIYRDQPALQTPFRIIRALLDIDETMTTWRYRHALMAMRMLGQKIGTGGSSGHKYLADATAKHKIFGDFFNLTTFFIPRSKVPPLPKSMTDRMNFHY